MVTRAIETTSNWLRQPEYTGENRCMPCTVVNVAIAGALAVLLGWLALPLGVVTFLLALAIIYVRGYLVPGTPELTKRHLPERVLGWFGKASVSTDEAAGPADDREAVDVEALLVDADVVEPCVDEDDLCLTDAFRAAWWERIRSLRADDDLARTTLADVLELDREAFDLEQDDDGRLRVVHEGRTIGQWASRGAFVADLAAKPELEARLPGWDGLEAGVRTQMLAGLRVFLDRCPACDTALEQVEDVRESCCSSRIVGIALECPSCDARVFRGRL